MAQFFFAWCDAADSTFSESAHAIELEELFSFEISQQEGEFATLSIEVVNPRVGLLNPGRQTWAWFSWDRGGSAGVEPLFFGRLVGVPERLEAEIVLLQLVARPSDYEAQKRTLAESLKVRPYYDPVWINPQLWNDPDAALEGRPAFWHVDRVSHDLTASDIIDGAGSTIVADHFYDSLSVSYRDRPANKVVCKATVRWQNEAKGSLDISDRLAAAFVAAGSSRGAQFLTTYTGEGLERSWPRDGQRIGAGWTVGANTLTRVDGGLASQLVYRIRTTQPVRAGFPLWTFAAQFSVDYEISRTYTETLSFEFGADVQPIAVDASEEDLLEVNLSSAAIDELLDLEGSVPVSPLRDSRWRSYFKTDRGKHSVEYLVCYCRAKLLARARCVEISFEAPFEDLAGVTCDDNAAISDARLPGGTATGKVVGYSLSLDGDRGELRASVTMACTIGRGGSVESSPGSPLYVADSYVADGYQAATGGATAIASSVSYSSFDEAPINDDGTDLANLTPDNSILSLVVVDGESAQETVLGSRTFEDISDAINELNGSPTQVALSLRPLNGGPFETIIPITVSDLAIPQTIDLEAESA